MQLFGCAVLSALAFSVASPVIANATVAGERYEVQRTARAESQSSDGSSSSSNDRDRISVRVIATGPEGIEFEYDLPQSATAKDRANVWQFPARILRPANGGAPKLINATELGQRLDPWLKLGGWDRRACGQWIFTWNAFKIECDPQSVLETVAAFDLQPPKLRAGEPYFLPGALAPTVLRQVKSEDGKTTFEANLAIDPEQVRNELAERDVVVGQIMREPKSIEVTRAERAKMQITGSMTVTLEADGAGQVLQRQVVIRIELIDALGVREDRTNNVKLERIPLPPLESDPKAVR